MRSVLGPTRNLVFLTRIMVFRITRNNPVQMEKLSKVNLHHIEQFAYFLDRLQSTPDGDGTLLDHMLMLYGCGISDGNQHLHVNLPILLAGCAAGRLRGGRQDRVVDGNAANQSPAHLARQGWRPDGATWRQYRPTGSPLRRLASPDTLRHPRD